MTRRPKFNPNEIQESVDRVLSTLEVAGIDPEYAVILGGSALALAGIRPTTNDVDIMVRTDHYQTMDKQTRTPRGVALRQKPAASNAFLETHPLQLPEGILPMDITHPRTNRTLHYPQQELDEIFMREIAQFNRAGGYAYLPPEAVALHKEGLGRKKDRRDIRLINAHLRKNS